MIEKLTQSPLSLELKNSIVDSTYQWFVENMDIPEILDYSFLNKESFFEKLIYWVSGKKHLYNQTKDFKQNLYWEIEGFHNSFPIYGNQKDAFKVNATRAMWLLGLKNHLNGIQIENLPVVGQYNLIQFHTELKPIRVFVKSCYCFRSLGSQIANVFSKTGKEYFIFSSPELEVFYNTAFLNKN